MASQAQTYAEAGFGQRVPRGTRPALLVVDFSYGFTDTAYPTAADYGPQMARTAKLAEATRALGRPVIYTTIAFDPAETGSLAWLRKSGGMAALTRGSRLVEIDPSSGYRPSDGLIEKKGASAFFGTNLAGLLASTQTDTLIVTGATTSGCVRASAVDAVQAGFNVLVAGDCCGDRAAAPHDASLYDIDQKYGDVTDSDDLARYLGGLAE
ncbi:isochorismatase family protein [Limimaricola pyoseonensis]|uniref:Nicotinamidase-related amidase n=1 Tax=Limimaricola pyoseonensis TaxID=521013 RepID=A0A1G7JH57_9RHOB|nr:isochorismatase family protein [Limimaricola pyoseonensis]SDF24243.1 Nicotinamidase-related amidase [Limimaricola pyoseonensis]